MMGAEVTSTIAPRTMLVARFGRTHRIEFASKRRALRTHRPKYRTARETPIPGSCTPPASRNLGVQMATQPSRAETGAVAETQAALARRQPKPADAGGRGAWASGHCIRQREFYETGAASLRPSLPEPRLASERAMRPEKPRFASEVRTGRTGMPVSPPSADPDQPAYGFQARWDHHKLLVLPWFGSCPA
jgi:hypothetical protein